MGRRRTPAFTPFSTLFCALDLADTVVLRRAAGVDSAGVDASFAPPLKALPDLGPPEQNLAVRAARAFVERAGLGTPPHIELVKRIPSGGGLGGGSSDAGAVLRALRRMHPRVLTASDLMEIAAGIGSDVPFFTQATPLALGAGHGERLTPVPPLPPRPVVLVLPPFAVSTAEAYHWLDESRRPDANLDTDRRDAFGRAGEPPCTWDQVADAAVNDFEKPVFDRHPDLCDIREAMQSLGARPALLAGSGSALFGVFAAPDDADAAVASLEAEYPRCRILRTGTRSR